MSKEDNEKISILLKKASLENIKINEEEEKKALTLIKGLNLSKKEKELQKKEKELKQKEKISKFLRDFLEKEKESKEDNEKISILLKKASLENIKSNEEEEKKALTLIKGLNLSKKEKELQKKEKELKEKQKISKFLRDFLEKEKENIKSNEEEEKKALTLIKGLNLSKKEKELQEKKNISKFLKILKKSKIYKSNENENIALKGTNVGAPIVPGSENDSYPTHDEKYGLGGYRSVEDYIERDSIPLQRRKEGMIVRTNSDGKEWVLLKDLETWVLNSIEIESVNALEQHLNFKANSQDADFYGKIDVNGELNTVFLNTNGHFNTGVILGESFSTGKICIKTKTLDFTLNDNIEVFIVPNGYMFMIDSIEVVTTKIVSPRSSPHIRFGLNGQNSAILSSRKMNINTTGARHIVEHPQQGLSPGSTVTMGVTETSTATFHQGVGLINGFLLKLNDENYLEIPPFYGQGLNSCESLIATVISCDKDIKDWIIEIEDLGYSNVRFEEKHSEYCDSCKDVTFFGSCCNDCNTQGRITYSDCKGQTFIDLSCCENQN